MYADKTLICRECGREFTFSASEQEFYASRGLLNEPGRCPECRAARKASGRGGASSSYASSGSSYRSQGNGGGYGGARESRQMYSAVCSNCGREALVPFQPTSGKPVYCRDCFAQMRTSRY
jgi:CxxC-x17-CxxC domain-containing protein